MRKTNTIKLLSVVWIVLFLISGISSYGQKSNNKKGDGKIHLKISQEINGKTIEIDTVYSPDQQKSVMAYLKSKGFSVEPPAPPDAPTPPPPPPPVPGMATLPPVPAPPLPSFLQGRDIIIYRDHDMTDEEKKSFEKDMENLREELNNMKLPEMPDLNAMDFNLPDIHIDESFFSKKERELFEKEMENLKEEMKQLKKNLENIRIEIKQEKGDSEGKEGGYLYDRQEDSYQLHPTSFNIYPNPGNGKFNLELTLGDQEPVQIKISDVNGKMIFEEKATQFDGNFNTEIDIADKGSGVYLLDVSQGDLRMYKKILIN